MPARAQEAAPSGAQYWEEGDDLLAPPTKREPPTAEEIASPDIESGAPAQAAQPDAPPVIDRIILAPKKKKKPPVEAPPVVDRIILKKKKKPPVPAPEPVVPVQAPIVAPKPVVAAPAPIAPQPQVPVALLFELAYRTGALEGPQLGVAYWFDESWGLGVRTGYASNRSTKTVSSASGRRLVTGTAWRTAPELSLLFSPAQAKNLRLVSELGGGMHFSKPERETVQRGVHAHLGLGVQWTVVERFSLQVGERLQWVSFRGTETADDISLATQLSASWWFE